MSKGESVRHEIQDLLVGLFVAVDEKDWAAARDSFVDTVYFDMTSLTGGEAGEVGADVIVAGWKDGLEPVEHVHHQTGNYRFAIAGDRASVDCYGIAYHYRETEGGPTITTFVGTYDFGLAHADGTWKVDALRFNAKFVDTRPASG